MYAKNQADEVAIILSSADRNVAHFPFAFNPISKQLPDCPTASPAVVLTADIL